MARSRNLINWLANQRVDAGAMRAMQFNMRRDMRRMFANLLYGRNASQQQHVLGQFTVEAASPADSTVTINRGTATGLEALPDTTFEDVVLYGADNATEKSLDFSLLAANVYKVWIRFSQDPGTPGVRVFYNADTEDEEGATVDTELVHDWDVQIAAVSPGTEWQELATVDWDGSTVTSGDITQSMDLFYEGDAGASYAHVWGSGVNDRNTDRAQYGIGRGLWEWVNAIRRQLSDIIGATSTGWYAAVPISLTQTKAHVDDASDPHGATLNQTDLVLGALANADTVLLEEEGTGNRPTVRTVIPGAIIYQAIDWQDGVAGSGAGAPSANMDAVYNGGARHIRTENGVLRILGVATLAVGNIDSITARIPVYFAGATGAGFGGNARVRRLTITGSLDVDDPPTVTLSLISINRLTGVDTVIASVDTSGVTAGAFSASTGTLTDAINNQANAYFLGVRIDSDGDLLSEMSVFTINVEWEKENVDTWV